MQCDWIGWCSGEQSAQCEGIDGCHPNDIGYGKIASLVKAAITSGERALKTDETATALKSDDGTGFYALDNNSNNVAYFSWYSYSLRDMHGRVQRAAKEPSASPGKTCTNLAMDGNLTFLRQSYEQLGVPGMMLLQESKWGSEKGGVFTQNRQWPNGSVGLTAGWEAAVDDCIVTLTPLAKDDGGHIHAIQLGDELVCTGFPLSNLSALAARLHTGLTVYGVMIFTNECLKHSFGNDCSSDADCIKLGSGAGPGVCEKGPTKWIVPNNPAFGACQTAVWPEIPSGLDAISADVYWTETGDYCPPGKRCPAGNGATEATWAKAYYSHYFLPLLKPHQSVWMLPGLFGPNGPHGSSTAMAATDKDLVEKMAAYWTWADAEPKITGCIPWLWGDLTKGFTPATMRWGGDAYPETLAWTKAKVMHLPQATRHGLFPTRKRLKLDDGETNLGALPTLDSVVYAKNTHGFKTFRIPSLVLASNGNLIALAEGRVRIAGPQVSCGSAFGKPGWQPQGNNTCCYGKLASDYDNECYDKDVVSKVSKDGGKTWTAFAMLSPGSNASHFYTNAVGLVDPVTKRAWAMYSICTVANAYGSCDDRWSSSIDNGDSWQSHPELDSFGNGRGMSGVGSGIVLKYGKHKGRLIFAQGCLTYSDDHGRSWHKGGETGSACGRSEQQCVETAADVILCASRSGWTPRLTLSVDGGATFAPGYQLDGSKGNANVTTDDCALSMIGVGSSLLLSHPNRPDIRVLRPEPIGRQNVTVSITSIGSSGHPSPKWRDYVPVYKGPSAYTSLSAVDAKGKTCAVLYERSAIGKLPVQFDSVNIATFPCVPT